MMITYWWEMRWFLEFTLRFGIRFLIIFSSWVKQMGQLVACTYRRSRFKHLTHKKLGQREIYSKYGLNNLSETFFYNNKIRAKRDAFIKIRLRDKDSLVARVRYNDFSILLPGDNMKPNQEEVVSFYESIDPGFLKSSVLKLSHHGSSYGTTKELIDAVQDCYP